MFEGCIACYHRGSKRNPKCCLTVTLHLSFLCSSSPLHFPLFFLASHPSDISNHRLSIYHSKTSCPFLGVSPEIRWHIYKLLFASTRLSFGIRLIFEGSDDEPEEKRIVPARNALAILRTCRLVHDEAKNTFGWEKCYSTLSDRRVC